MTKAEQARVVAGRIVKDIGHPSMRATGRHDRFAAILLRSFRHSAVQLFRLCDAVRSPVEPAFKID